MKKSFFIFGLILIMFLNTTPTYANMIWPSLYIIHGMMIWWIITIGLIIEYVFIKIFTKDGFLKSALMTIVINTISILVGIFLIPLSGIFGELILLPFDVILNIGTFHISHWMLAFFLTVLCNATIEVFALKLIFKKKLKEVFLWLFCANTFSVIICALKMWNESLI